MLFILDAYPSIQINNRWIQKGDQLLKKYLPRFQRYLERERALGNADKSILRVYPNKSRKVKRLAFYFRMWRRKEILKRYLFLIAEGLVLPFTPFLAVIPGPNIFFYIPLLLFYFHLKSLKALRNLPEKQIQYSSTIFEKDR